MLSIHNVPSGVGCFVLTTRDVPLPGKALLALESLVTTTLFEFVCEISIDRGAAWKRLDSFWMTSTFSLPDPGLVMSANEIMSPPEGIYLKPFCLAYKPLDELPVEVSDVGNLWVRVRYRREDGSTCSVEVQHLTHIIRDE